jgi:2-amino-4-hydroxy-6-hydroxymethyldihydropteridine diphosphokinase
VVRAAIGLGSNVGDRARHINEAVGSLSELGKLIAVSSLYETAPIGGPEQGPYLNAVAVIETDLPAGELLQRCLTVERTHGRERIDKWGPRTLDLDILLYGSETISEPSLTVPHPRMIERRFVLEPLLEAWPQATLPGGLPLQPYLEAVSHQDVRRTATLPADRSTTLALFLVVVVAALAIWWIGDWLLSWG